MVDVWFLNNNNAIGTIFILLSILALLIAIVSVSQSSFFAYALSLGILFFAIGSYFWHNKSFYFNAKLQPAQSN